MQTNPLMSWWSGHYASNEVVRDIRGNKRDSPGRKIRRGLSQPPPPNPYRAAKACVITQRERERETGGMVPLFEGRGVEGWGVINERNNLMAPTFQLARLSTLMDMIVQIILKKVFLLISKVNNSVWCVSLFVSPFYIFQCIDTRSYI